MKKTYISPSLDVADLYMGKPVMMTASNQYAKDEEQGTGGGALVKEEEDFTGQGNRNLWDEEW